MLTIIQLITSLIILANFIANSAVSQDTGPFNFDISRLSPDNLIRNNVSSLMWQPLRSSFRPPISGPFGPAPPRPPSPPSPPEPPTSLSLLRSELDPTAAESREVRFGNIFAPAPSPFARTSNPNNDPGIVDPNTVTPAPANLVTTLNSRFSLEDEQPTRVPMNRFRPTRAPSEDRDIETHPVITTIKPQLVDFVATSGGLESDSNNNNNNQSLSSKIISNECFECICEASTNCNPQSRCQSSDVRHTKCGLFLISYDQWLASGLSKRLVSPEALAQDISADERAYYECVTRRDCAEELMSIYMQSNARDCDRDGRIDCYDIAAIHQGGIDQCNSEAFLESQYWSDFNACYGFA